MGLGEIEYEDVIAATEEFRRLGRDSFLQTYGFGRATSYELVLDGFRYDSKAIAGVAHGHATGDFLSPGDFSGGAATVARRLFRGTSEHIAAAMGKPVVDDHIPGQRPEAAVRTEEGGLEASVSAPVEL
ncbi:hypothetical protein [Streptomyces sp. NPDC052292]|uniref:hypothetical protein n=1 Tax=Streptomyces sp. NPDC052292 TaxID=3155053 RepID=UPI0034243781